MIKESFKLDAPPVDGGLRELEKGEKNLIAWLDRYRDYLKSSVDKGVISKELDSFLKERLKKRRTS